MEQTQAQRWMDEMIAEELDSAAKSVTSWNDQEINDSIRRWTKLASTSMDKLSIGMLNVYFMEAIRRGIIQ